jgi:CDP-glycerol glycerophosphotransferase (TagB/SpsB family)
MKFHYGKGYFEYNTDGFGPITYNLTDTINMLKYYIETNFSVEKKYTDNKNKFFILEEKKNCQRVYDAIINCKQWYYKK